MSRIAGPRTVEHAIGEPAASLMLLAQDRHEAAQGMAHLEARADELLLQLLVVEPGGSDLYTPPDFLSVFDIDIRYTPARQWRRQCQVAAPESSMRSRRVSDDIHPMHLHRHTFELARIMGKLTAIADN